jgi:hypothetical protein
LTFRCHQVLRKYDTGRHLLRHRNHFSWFCPLLETLYAGQSRWQTSNSEGWISSMLKMINDLWANFIFSRVNMGFHLLNWINSSHDRNFVVGFNLNFTEVILEFVKYIFCLHYCSCFNLYSFHNLNLPWLVQNP